MAWQRGHGWPLAPRPIADAAETAMPAMRRNSLMIWPASAVTSGRSHPYRKGLCTERSENGRSRRYAGVVSRAGKRPRSIAGPRASDCTDAAHRDDDPPAGVGDHGTTGGCPFASLPFVGQEHADVHARSCPARPCAGATPMHRPAASAWSPRSVPAGFRPPNAGCAAAGSPSPPAGSPPGGASADSPKSGCPRKRRCPRAEAGPSATCDGAGRGPPSGSP